MLALVGSCIAQHHLRLLLGPSPGKESAGFGCKDASGTPLIYGIVPNGARMTDFSLIVDVVDLGAHLPGCLASDIISSCSDGSCKLLVSDAPQRYCQHLQIPLPVGAPIDLAYVEEYLHENAPPIVTVAPHRPVVFRVVITTTPNACDLVNQNDGQVWAPLTTNVLGCAYSCPAVLDDVSGPISLSIDALDDQCESIVRVCAGFPAP